MRPRAEPCPCESDECRSWVVTLGHEIIARGLSERVACLVADLLCIVSVPGVPQDEMLGLCERMAEVRGQGERIISLTVSSGDMSETHSRLD